MMIEFEIKTKPVPQARPRFFVRHTGHGHMVGAYDPKRSRRFKEIIAWHARIAAGERGIREPFSAPIALSLIFQMGRGDKQRFHTKRPDIDNLAKAVKDALKGIIYHDDSQIVEAHLYKTYGEHLIRVKVMALEER